MEENIRAIVNKLDRNTMFRLSLGSKELFHSNFLEFLWDKDKDAFLEMLKALLPDKKRFDILKDKKIIEHLQIARERENLDLCIYYHFDEEIENDDQGEESEEELQDNEEDKGMGKNDIYCIIIENKVKSIPYKSQLDGYIGKVNEHNKKKAIQNKIQNIFKEKDFQPIYILLSLAKEFSQKEAIEKEQDNTKKWNIIHYNQLSKEIRCKYWIFNKYIRDYVRFVEKLDILGEKIIESRKSKLITQKDIHDMLQRIRLHDLYLKLRGSIFIGEVYDKIHKKFDNNTISFEKADRKKKNIKIFLSSTMNNGKATVDAAIVHKKGDDTIFYVIQIEGNQYRHMINKLGLADDCSVTPKGKKRAVIDLTKVEDINILGTLSQEYKFLNFEDPFQVACTSLKKNHENYCKYKPNIVYRYKEFDGTLESMLEIMCDDIVNTWKKLMNLE